MNNNPIQWLAPFDDRFGSEMIYRLFSVGASYLALGFNELKIFMILTIRQLIYLSLSLTSYFLPAEYGLWHSMRLILILCHLKVSVMLVIPLITLEAFFVRLQV